MIILITGATHTGKTALAQKMMEKLHIPYYCQDHIKMGLIRSGYNSLHADAPDEKMTECVWPVTREIIKTAIENNQSLIMEGCYVPFEWKNDFEEEYLKEIRYLCVCFSDAYIDNHYAQIMQYQNCVEKRLDDGYCTMELLKKENQRYRLGCRKMGLPVELIDEAYEQTIQKILNRYE